MKIFKKNSWRVFLCVLLLSLFSFPRVTIKANDNSQEKVFYLNNNQSIEGTLFTSDELLSPGDKLIKNFYIANDNDFKCILKSIIIDGKIYNNQGKLLKKEDTEYQNFIKNSKINFYCEDKIIYSGNVDEVLTFNLADENSTDIEKGSKKKFKIEYSLGKEADESTMGLQHKFNINFNFSAVDAAVIDEGGGTTIEKGVLGGNLVQTGYFMDTKVLLIAGSLLCITGLLLFIKRKANN